MYNFDCDTLQESLYNILCCLKETKNEVQVKDNLTYELHPCNIQINYPTQRTLLYPKRGNNPFATLAETLWVLAGRNDVDWLLPFLPRAKDFSDDWDEEIGKGTWRSGYGSRIFYYGVRHINQLKYVYETLKKDHSSRQAVMVLWNPQEECIVENSKDMPCCDLQQFLIRDGKLDITVYIRSNDLVFGFSGINMYEWTVTQELLAGLLGIPVGKYYQISNSMHIYKRHFKKMDTLVKSYEPLPDIPIFKFYRGEEIIYEKLFSEINSLVIFYEDQKNHVSFNLKSLSECWYLLRIYRMFLDMKNNQKEFNNYRDEIFSRHLYFNDLSLACYWWLNKQFDAKATISDAAEELNALYLPHNIQL